MNVSDVIFYTPVHGVFIYDISYKMYVVTFFNVKNAKIVVFLV